MTSRTLLNLTLAIALASLIALAIFKPGSKPVTNEEPLTLLKPDDVQKIRVHLPGHTDIELTKIDGQWTMLAPFSVPANQQRIAQLLKITSAKILATYTIDKTDTQQLGLDTPSLTLTLNDTRLDFGGTAPLGGSRYVRIENSIHLITDRYSHLVRGAATELVRPTLLNTTDQIIGLQLPTLKLTLVDGKWQLESQQAANTSNPDSVQKLLDEWRHGRAFEVKALDTTLDTSDTENPESSLETIIVITQKSSLRFSLRRTDDEIILQRRDLGLQYHFSKEVGKQLLTLPQLKDA